jgi:hypothetical protein
MFKPVQFCRRGQGGCRRIVSLLLPYFHDQPTTAVYREVCYTNSKHNREAQFSPDSGKKSLSNKITKKQLLNPHVIRLGQSAGDKNSVKICFSGVPKQVWNEYDHKVPSNETSKRA